MVALDADDGLGDSKSLFGKAESHLLGESGEGGFIPVGHAHPPTDRHVVTEDLLLRVVEDGDEP